MINSAHAGQRFVTCTCNTARRDSERASVLRARLSKFLSATICSKVIYMRARPQIWTLRLRGLEHDFGILQLGRLGLGLARVRACV